MLTKKDYVAISSILKPYVDDENDPVHAAVFSISMELSAYFKEDNPRFNVEKFLAACGIPFKIK